MNPLIKWLALRNFKFKKGYLSFAFIISILGVIVGVAALIIVNAVMTGFQDAIKQRLLSSNADIIVMKGGKPFDNYDYVERRIAKLPHVTGTEPFLYVPVMAVSSDASSAASASIRGCYPDKEKRVTDLPEKIILGDWEIFKRDKDGAVIGKILADTLGVTLGDKIKVISPLGRKTPFGIIPRTATFRVDGIFEVGMYQFDSSLILAHIDTVRKKFGFGNVVTGIMVKVDNPDNVKIVEKEIQKVLGQGYYAEDWISLNKNLFSALKLEKLAMFLILTLIVIVASFNISSLLMMNINAKAKDIAILKTVGADNSLILKIFIFQGFLIGLIGTIIGEVIGIGISILGEKYKLIPLPPDVYYIDHLPFNLHASDCITAAVAAIIISVIATIYPSLKAAKTEPVKILRSGEQ
ncbi:lipoprotein-releasing system permease protein [Desulfurobacterium pacificum]|uniref:Lipoprotein-releasing system permease protein n=1 Tax=Desulfurobacterium pacificum TaxID=240166 RepID=A0ABY1NNJ6_9BACT|nr:ABC transporter permease [Desulfurobacterium pacificum]SMP14086.1 lipoprotein-releasing system permease protein [Desulfurobacterium pacificum]